MLIVYFSDELVYEFINKVYEEWYCWFSGLMFGCCLCDVYGVEYCWCLELYFEWVLVGESVIFEIVEIVLFGEECYM